MRTSHERNQPSGVLHATFEQLHAAGCIQTGADREPNVQLAKDRHERMFNALQVETHGNMCAGCPAHRGGECKAFQQFHSQPQLQRRSRQARIDEAIKPKGTSKYPGMSVAQIAAATGMSKSQVRRLKACDAI